MQTLNSIRDSGVGAGVTAAVAWWKEEMAALVPQLGSSGSKRAAIEIIPSRSAVDLEIVSAGQGQTLREERPLERLDEDSWAELRSLCAGAHTSIVLRPPDVFLTTLRLPRVPLSRLRSAVALQLLHAAPVDPAFVCWEIGGVASDVEDEALRVQVVMARQDRLAFLQELFEEHGLGAPAVKARSSDRLVTLARGRRPRREGSAFDRRAWLIAGCLVASVPLTTIVAAGIAEAQLEARIAELQSEASPRLEGAAAARRAEDLRRNLRLVLGRPTLTQTLEDLAIAVPATDHVRAAEHLPDRSIRFIVNSGNVDALEASLAESPLLRRASVEDMVPTSDGRMVARLRTPPL